MTPIEYAVTEESIPIVSEPAPAYAAQLGIGRGNKPIVSSNDVPDMDEAELHVLTARVESYFARMREIHQVKSVPEGYVTLEEADMHFRQELRKSYARKRDTVDA